MADQPFLLLLALLYVGLLFVVAWWADRHQRALQRYHPLIYSLALAVYCSSWTFYGAVGQAADNPWDHVPIYLGPALLFIFGGRLWQKLLMVGERHKVTSVADFIGARYGKSQGLAALVTGLAILGSLPYIALQLKAVTMSWDLMSGGGIASPLNEATMRWDLVSGGAAPEISLPDTGLITAILMALFAILFGTRYLEGRERNFGLISAIATESLVKLFAFGTVAFLAIALLLANGQQMSAKQDVLIDAWFSNPVDSHFITQGLLAAMAMLCLPRQFHVAVVEYRNQRDRVFARYLMPIYLLLFAVLVFPIVLAGQLLFSGQGVAPDSYVLTLPLANQEVELALLAFIGGFSAATGMVIVSAVTLSAMVSNELVVPLWLHFGRGRTLRSEFLGKYLRRIRRISILLLLLAAWAVHRLMIDFQGLASIGLLSFAAAAQFAPALIAALYWRGGHRQGVLAGLVAGYGLWLYCLVLPTFLPAGSGLLAGGPWGISWLHPQQLFGLVGLDPLSHGVFWSLLCNSALFVGVSFVSVPTREDQRQAESFVGVAGEVASSVADLELTSVKVGQLRGLLRPFVDQRRIEELWNRFERRCQQRLLADDAAPRFVVWEVEGALAGIVGAASAGHAIELLERGRSLQLEDFATLVDGTSQQLRFSQDLLQTTIETISQGISVVDADLRLMAWNNRYEELFDYPERLLYVGCPIGQLYRYNAERGMLDNPDEDIESAVAKRLNHLRVGGVHRFERRLPSGVVIEVQGTPMPSGGFVTTFTDISDYKAAVEALEEAKATLKERVALRTAALSDANAALQEENRLRAEAEGKLRELHASKSRFLAATSHDLLQPINAARLFAAAIQQNMERGERAGLEADVANIDGALATAEELIGALREISRLDAGNLTPQVENFPIDRLLRKLSTEFQALASAKDLRIRKVDSSAWVSSDPHLLRRILQNFLDNALRYTARGRVLLGCRHRGDDLVIEVWDTGPGIPEEMRERIFDEFVRLAPGERSTDKGLGLGLSIALRTARLLNHEVEVRSESGRGSVFSVRVPLGRSDAALPAPRVRREVAGDLSGVTVLCIENERSILDGMDRLLSGWGCEVTTAESLEVALQAWLGEEPPAVVIADYHLDAGANGIEALEALVARWGRSVVSGIVISADTREDVRNSALTRGYYYLSKPVKPASLRSLIRRLVRLRSSQPPEEEPVRSM